jgi:catechol 2,3-dioxygenase-like lactoylglutathione lyase family enzyme
MPGQSNAHPTGFSPTTNTAVVRYQAKDVDRSVAFYTKHLGFRLTQRSGPIAIVSRGDLHLILSGPGSSGARDMPDGRHQDPGGWNRITIYVDNLQAIIDGLKDMGDVTFRNEVESGPGGSQILLDDPDGNPIELHEPPRQDRRE